MEIKLDEKWYLTSDTSCYKLAVLYNDKEKDKLKSQKYYTTLEGALSGYIEIKVKESGARSFTELKKDIEEITDKIKNTRDIFKSVKINIEMTS